VSYVITETAEQDLEEILAYIAQDNLQAAYKWLDKLYEAMEKLS
jgi:plasmid stabilization system protein ParE